MATSTRNQAKTVMPRRLILLGAVGGAAIVVGACHPMRHHSAHLDRPLTVAGSLTCPDQVGALTRVSASSDGHACSYSGDQGEQVDLTLTALNGQNAQAVMAPTEAALRVLLPSHGGPDTQGDAAKPDLASVEADGDHAKVAVPFVHVDADGDKAQVKVFGITINADRDNAHVQTGWGPNSTSIHAGPGGAEIRVADLGHGSANLVYILAGDNPGPAGWRTVGYLARGPAAGPLVVATFKSRAEDKHDDDHDHDLDQLLDLNVHG
jgi:hypothetical protein